MLDPLSVLSESSLLRGAPAAAMQMLREAASVRHFPGGSVLFREGDPAEAIYVIASGRVKITHTNLEGRERIFNVLTSPEVLGELSVIRNSPRSVTAYCLDDVTALAIYRDDLRVILDRHPAILWNLAAVLAKRLDEANHEMELLSFSTTRACVAHALHTLYLKGAFVKGANGDLVIEFTHQDLANRTGNSRETITRVLKNMEEEGLVRSRTGTITLLKPGALEEIIYGLGDD